MPELLKLRRFLDAAPRRRLERCEFCGAELVPAHGHVVDKEDRRLLCSCRPCYLLFTEPGAARYRSVPDRYLNLGGDAAGPMTDIPVGIAFFLHSSKQGRTTAFYPSPAGATESGLPIESWQEMIEANPALATLEPDVEALLVCRRRERAECWILPVDACYELVGRLRHCWKGFDGGSEAWGEIDAFFASLAERGVGSCA